MDAASSLYSVESRSPVNLSSISWCDVQVEDSELCDTCSGEGDIDETDDETVSLCSWTTDQGDWDGLVALASPGWLSGRTDTPSHVVDTADTAEACISFVPVFMPMAPFWQIDHYYGGCSVGSAPGNWQSEDQSQLSVSSKTLAAKKHDWAVPAPAAPSLSQADDEDESTKTTVIFRRLPKDCGRDALVKILDSEKFKGLFDFVHFPIEFHSNEPLGYAVVNLINHDAAKRVMKHFESFDRWPGMEGEPCEIAWNHPLQGRIAHVERYRNSPLMHHSVPEYYRPLLFRKGARVAFPRPTTRVRAPRIRNQW